MGIISFQDVFSLGNDSRSSGPIISKAVPVDFDKRTKKEEASRRRYQERKDTLKKSYNGDIETGRVYLDSKDFKLYPLYCLMEDYLWSKKDNLSDSDGGKLLKSLDTFGHGFDSSDVRYRIYDFVKNKNGVDINGYINSRGVTPLELALDTYWQIDVAEILLQNGADANVCSSQTGRPLLLHTIHRKLDEKVSYFDDSIQLLLKYGASLTAADTQGETILDEKYAKELEFALTIPEFKAQYDAYMAKQKAKNEAQQKTWLSYFMGFFSRS